jgi:hypothetical protein
MRDTITIVITAAPAAPGAFIATLSSSLPLCCSHEPLLAAARELLRRGASADAILQMRYEGSDTIALRARLGTAAGLTIEDGPNGAPRVRRWKMPPRMWGQRPPINFGTQNDPRPLPVDAAIRGGRS